MHSSDMQQLAYVIAWVAVKFTSVVSEMVKISVKLPIFNYVTSVAFIPNFHCYTHAISMFIPYSLTFIGVFMHEIFYSIQIALLKYMLHQLALHCDTNSSQ